VKPPSLTVAILSATLSVFFISAYFIYFFPLLDQTKHLTDPGVLKGTFITLKKSGDFSPDELKLISDYNFLYKTAPFTWKATANLLLIVIVFSCLPWILFLQSIFTLKKAKAAEQGAAANP
jgi:hypothetical protein